MDIPVDVFIDRIEERVALGDIIAHPSQIGRYVEVGYAPELFADERHRMIWRAFVTLFGESVDPDFPAVRRRLADLGAKDVTAAYLSGLDEGVPRQSAQNIAQRQEKLDTLARCRTAYYEDRSFVAHLAENPAAINNGLLGKHIAELEMLGTSATAAAAPLQHDAEILTLPDPEFLIDGMIPAGALVTGYGEPGIGKTFVFLHLAFCVASGRAFFGAPVRSPGPVVYVVSEGAAGIRARVGAWKLAHQVDLEQPMGVHFWSGSVSLLDPSAIRAFVMAVRAVRPRLVVLDTLARCLVGGDENSARDMGLAVASADRIRTDLNATVILVHHQNKSGGSERGSSALRGACDTMLQITRADDVLRLEASKQKDAELFDPIDLKIIPAYPGASSCIVCALAEAPASNVLTDSQGKVLHALTELFTASGASTKDLEEAVHGMHRVTYFKARRALVDKGLVIERNKRWFPALHAKVVAGSSLTVAEPGPRKLQGVAG